MAASLMRATLILTMVALIGQSLVLFAIADVFQLRLNLGLQLILLAIFGLWMRRRTGTYLSAPLLFAVAIYFWHSTFLTGHFFSLAPMFEFTGNIFTYGYEQLPYATALVGLCLACAVAGTLLGEWGSGRGSFKRVAEATDGCWRSAARRYAWVIFIALFTLTMAYLIFEGVKTFDLGYMSLYTDASESLLYRTFQSTKFFCVTAILMIFAAFGRRRRLTPVIACALLVLVNVLMGSRSMPFIFALTVIISIDVWWRNFKGIELAAVAVAGSAASFVIDQTRGAGLGMHIFDFASTGKSIDLIQIFWNAGGTIQTILRTIEFSASSGLLYGRSFFDAVIYLAPRALIDGLGFRTGLVVPSVWLVEQSRDLLPGQGMGYSLVAESYLNFGWAGCLVFLLIGWFIGRYYFMGKKHGDAFATLQSYNVAILFSLNMRSEAGSYLRAIVYGYLMIEGARWLHGPAMERRTLIQS